MDGRTPPLTFGSLFSGIGGIDLGLERAGVTCRFQCEVEPYRRAVLRKHFAGIPIYEDIRTLSTRDLPHVDLLCGGFPCQDLSVAGKRAGLAGERSGLFFEFLRVIDGTEPEWLLIENVPGLLTSHKGADFTTVLRALVERGYGVCWRVLDSQNFGVPQRRRRVFIVGHRGDVERAGEILLECEGGDRNPAPSRAQGADAPNVAEDGATADGPLVFEPRYARNGRGKPDRVAPPLKAHNGRTGKGDGAPSVIYATDIAVMEDGREIDKKQNGLGVSDEDPTVLDKTDAQAVAYRKATSFGHDKGFERWEEADHIACLDASGQIPRTKSAVVSPGLVVRRLTPRECERLQGFPDDWTLIDWKDGTTADSLRYAACGDAVTVPVAEWIAHRIIAVANADEIVPTETRRVAAA